MAKNCPICGKPAETKYRPFCSKHCADVDLGRWLKGTYVIPGTPDSEEDGTGAAGSTGQRDDTVDRET